MNPIEMMKLAARVRKIRENYGALQKEGNMLSIGQILKSRTVWVTFAGVIFNGWNAMNKSALDPHVVAIIDGVLGLAAMYFRIAPNQLPK